MLFASILFSWTWFCWSFAIIIYCDKWFCLFIFYFCFGYSGKCAMFFHKKILCRFYWMASVWMGVQRHWLNSRPIPMKINYSITCRNANTCCSHHIRLYRSIENVKRTVLACESKNEWKVFSLFCSWIDIILYEWSWQQVGNGTDCCCFYRFFTIKPTQ